MTPIETHDAGKSWQTAHLPDVPTFDPIATAFSASSAGYALTPGTADLHVLRVRGRADDRFRRLMVEELQGSQLRGSLLRPTLVLGADPIVDLTVATGNALIVTG